MGKFDLVNGQMPQAASSAPTGADPSVAGAITYTFPAAVGYVRIEALSACPATLKVLWNSASASATVYDAVIEAGDHGAVTNPRGLAVKTVSIYFDAACTRGTHWIIRGI